MAECSVCTAPSGDDGLLCRTHTDELVRELRDVPALVDELDITVTRQDRVTPGSTIGRAAERPLVWNENAAAKRSELWSTIGAWALDVAKLGEDERDRLSDIPGHDTANVARWIVRNVSTLRQHPEAGTAFDELTDAIRSARRAIDRAATATRFYAGPCPEIIEAETSEGVVESVYCDGEVWAFIPVEADKLAYLRCQACDMGWDTTQWLRIGRKMLTRIAQLRAVKHPA